jgi:phage virion morphogenesis protein
MRIKLVAKDGITQALQQLSSSGRNLTPAMIEISETLHSETMANFDAQGRPTMWPVLAESTLKRRPDRIGGMILQDKQGGLKSSIQAAHGAAFAEVRTNKVYARIHQLGGKTGRRHAAKIPPRPYFWISDEGWDEIMDIISNHLDGAAQ